MGYVWFSYNLSTRSTTYLLVNCPNNARDQIVHCALRENPELLVRPCTIDTFLANNYCSEWARNIDRSRKNLLAYVSATQVEYCLFSVLNTNPPGTCCSVSIANPCAYGAGSRSTARHVTGVACNLRGSY